MSKILHEGKWLVFKEDGGWEFVDRVGDQEAICGVVWIGDKIVVVDQLRKPTGERILELPAGLIDKGEKPLKAIVRETKEETGVGIFVGARCPSIFKTYSSPGMTSEVVHMVEFWKDAVNTLGAQTLDAEEDIKVRLMTVHELYNCEEPMGARLRAFVMGYTSALKDNVTI